MAQAPDPLTMVPSEDYLAATSKATADDIHRVPYLLVFIYLRQRGILGMLPTEVLHLEASLLQS